MSIKTGNEIGVGLAATNAIPADGLIPMVIPAVLRSSSDTGIGVGLAVNVGVAAEITVGLAVNVDVADETGTTKPVSDESRGAVLEKEIVVTVRLPDAIASGAGFTRTVATRKYPDGPGNPRVAPASYCACPATLLMVAG